MARRVLKWALWFGAALQFTACSADDEQERSGCTQIGCGSTEVLQLSLEMPAADVNALDLTLCRDEVCFDGSLDAEPGAPILDLIGTRSRVLPHARLNATGDDRYELTCDWSGAEPSEVADGTLLRISLRRRDGGEVVFEREVVAEGYEVSYPNGKRCGPGCHHKTIDLGRI